MNEPRPGHHLADQAAIESAYAWLIRMQSGRATQADRLAFDAWLAENPSHAQAYAEAKALWHDPELTEALHRSRPGPRAQRPARRRWPAALALSCALAFAIHSQFWIRLQADYLTAVGERRSVTLADGSNLLLDTDTAVAVDFSANRRIRVLRGAAYCDVRPDPSRPFVVAGRHGEARALGTRFSVRTDATADTVTVAHGRVQVEPGEASDAARILGIDEQIGVESRQLGNVVKTSAQQALAWTRGSLIFQQTPLADAVEQLQRYLPGILLVRNPRLREFRVSGRYSLDDPDRVLDILAKTLPIRVHRYTPWMTVID